MDWLSSLSPDSSDEEADRPSEHTIKPKSSSESHDKIKNKIESNSGSLSGEDSSPKSDDSNTETQPNVKSNLKDTDKLNKTELDVQKSCQSPPLAHTNKSDNLDSDDPDTKTSSDNSNDFHTDSGKDGSFGQKTDNSADSSNQPSSSLFSIASTTRKINKYNNIVIKSQELSESEIRELVGPRSSSNRTTQSSLLGRHTHAGRLGHADQRLPSSQFTHSSDPDHAFHTSSYSEYVEKVDFNETLHSFNRSNLNMEKLTNQWVESNLNIKEIKADDLLAGSEKERLTRNPLITDDRKKFSLTTRLMETEDGQVITTNVARRTQKRKHQINWLAMEAQDKEMEILERTAHMRKSKRETQMKYGW